MIFFVVLCAASKQVGAQYELQMGKTNGHLWASTMHNALFVGNSGSDQCWVMHTGTPQQARVGKGKYALVVVDSALNEKLRLPFQKARGTSVLGATMTDGVAEMLLMDQSVHGQTLYLHHNVRINEMVNVDDAHFVDALFSLDYGRHDTCKVWVAQSASGQRTAVLTVVQYAGRKQYSAIATLYDEHLRPLWSHDVETGSVGSIAVSNDGCILAFAHRVNALSTNFFFTVIDSLGSRTTRLQHADKAVNQALLVGFDGHQALVLGLYLDTLCKNARRCSSGRLAMSFDAKTMQITATTLIPYTNYDINTLQNQQCKHQNIDRVVRDVRVIDVIPTPYGAVMQTACVATTNHEDDEGNDIGRHTLKGIHLLAVDWRADTLWQTNIAAYEQRDVDAMNMGGLMFANADKLLLVKNEHRRTSSAFGQQTEARLTSYDKKTSLVLYEVTLQGKVSKQILQRKIRFSPLLAFNQGNNGTSLLFEEKGRVLPGRLFFAGGK